MTEKIMITMWISVGLAISCATIVTGNALCLFGFAAPSFITFFVLMDDA